MKQSILIILLFSVFTHSIKANGITPPFEVRVSGKGQPILFIPGATCSGDEWQAAVAHYSKNYECHVFTLAGYAGAPAIADGPYLPTFKTALINYVGEHKLKNVIVVGHSIGGFLSLKLAIEMKDALQKIVVVDAMPFYAGALNPAAKAGFSEVQAKQFLDGYNKMNDAELKASQRNIARTLCADSSKWDAIAEWGGKSDRKTMAYSMAEMFGDDIREDIAKIKVPVLVLAAFKAMPEYPGFTKDYITSTFKEQYKQCTTCTISVSSSAKHFVMYDEPEWFLKEIDNFIQRP